MVLFTEVAAAFMPLASVATIHLAARQWKSSVVAAFQRKGSWGDYQVKRIQATQDDERPQDLHSAPSNELSAMRKSTGSLFVQIREEHCFNGIFGLEHRYHTAVTAVRTPRNILSGRPRFVLPKEAPKVLHINTQSDLQKALRLCGFKAHDYTVSLPAIFRIHPIPLDRDIIAIDDPKCNNTWYGSDDGVISKFVEAKILPWENGAKLMGGVASCMFYFAVVL